MTKRPARDRRNREAARNMGTFVALAALLFIGMAFLGLLAVVFPKAVWLVVVVFGFAMMGLVQYLTWGRWLSRNLAEEDEEG